MTTTSEPTVAAPTDSDRIAIAALTQRVVAAWAYHDAKAFAGVFTEDGTMILPGVFQQGKAAIEAYMAAAFQGDYQGTQVTGKPLDLRFLGREGAVLITLGGVLRPGESEVADDEAIRATWTAVKVDGEWWLAAYQNTPRHKKV
jgi:uncharacterized protein (TIGR02246 family)